MTHSPYLSSQIVEYDMQGKIAHHNKRFLGEGSFGYVYKYKTEEGDWKVVKIIDTRYFRGKKLEAVAREMAVVRLLRHRGVMPAFEAFVLEKNAFIFMDKASCDLKCIIQNAEKEGKIPLPKSETILKQVLEAIIYLHALKLVHRDIKPDNVMVNLPTLEAKLIDFGLCGICGKPDWRTHEGCPQYTAPEVPVDGCFNPASDVYSVAMLAVHVKEGTRRVHEWNDLIPYRLIPPETVMEEVWQTVLCADASERPSAADVLKQLGGPPKEEVLPTTPTAAQIDDMTEEFLSELKEEESECLVSLWIEKKFQVKDCILSRLFGTKIMTWTSFKQMDLRGFRSSFSKSEYSQLEAAWQYLQVRSCFVQAQQEAYEFARDQSRQALDQQDIPKSKD